MKGLMKKWTKVRRRWVECKKWRRQDRLQVVGRGKGKEVSWGWYLREIVDVKLRCVDCRIGDRCGFGSGFGER